MSRSSGLRRKITVTLTGPQVWAIQSALLKARDEAEFAETKRVHERAFIKISTAWIARERD